MCGRFDFHSDAAELAAFIETQGEIPPETQRYNLPPTRRATTAVWDGDAGLIRLQPMKFGISWPHRPGQVINARSETVTQKPMFRNAFKSHRCLVFANGFYEWTRAGKLKQPHYFHLKNAVLMAFAGIYNHSEDSGHSFVILTTEANTLMAPLHHRMPVILPANTLRHWVKPETPAPAVEDMLVPYSSACMTTFPVSTAVNRPQYDGPACIAPLQDTL